MHANRIKHCTHIVLNLICVLFFWAQASLRRCDKEILQDLWKVRTGIHDIREIHRKQINAENKYLDTSVSSSLEGQRRQSEAEEGLPDSPISPLSPFSPPPGMSRLSVSAFDLKGPSPGPKSDDAILKSFFGDDSMNKLTSMMQQSTEGDGEQRKCQSTDRLISAGLPPIPEKKRSKAYPISRSPKNSRVHASTPDMSSLRRTNHPVSDVCSEMQKLRMRLCETANQTVAEIEERFSPKLNRLTLGPMVDVPTDPTLGGGGHTHQGSLDSFPSNSPLIESARHNRQHSLPLSVVAQAQQYPHTGTAAPSSPKSPPSSFHHGHSNSNSRSPTSRSPTPPHQAQHGRQASLGSSGVSGLVTSRYQNQPYEVPANSHRQQQPQYSARQQTNNGSSGGLYKTPPPSMTRQYSPSTRSQGPGVQTNYVFGNQRPNGVTQGQQQSNHTGSYDSRMYSSNPNLLSGDSTHYSTAVIKKRRSSGNKSGTSQSSLEPPAQFPNEHGVVYNKLRQHASTSSVQPTAHSRPTDPFHDSYHSHPSGQTHPTNLIGSQNSHSELSHRNHAQRRIASSSNVQQEPQEIRPYMSTGELRASMKFQYVPFAQQRSAIVHGRAYSDAENTWL